MFPVMTCTRAPQFMFHEVSRQTAYLGRPREDVKRQLHMAQHHTVHLHTLVNRERQRQFHDLLKITQMDMQLKHRRNHALLSRKLLGQILIEFRLRLLPHLCNLLHLQNHLNQFMLLFTILMAKLQVKCLSRKAMSWISPARKEMVTRIPLFRASC